MAVRNFSSAGGMAQQQYELELIEDPTVTRRGRVAQAAPRGQALATIIDVEPEATASGGRRSRPSKAKPAFLPADVTAEEAFRLTLTQCKWHIAANVPPVLEVRQAEGMHQLRVGFRRLRVAFTSFGGEFRTPSVEALRLKTKKISSRLASARDLDVFLSELFEPAATVNGSVDAFEVLRTRAQSTRRRAWEDAVSCVLSPAFAGFMSELSAVIDNRMWREGVHTSAHAATGHVGFEAPAIRLAERMLDHRLARAKKRARHLKTLSDAKRHRLRIALKKLRYTADFFAPLYGQDDVQRFVRRLGDMQDVLGVLQDVVVARTTLEHLVEIDDGMSRVPQTSLSFAAGMVYGWQLECASHTWESAVRRWRKFIKTKPFWAIPD